MILIIYGIFIVKKASIVVFKSICFQKARVFKTKYGCLIAFIVVDF